ncbi:MAG: glucose-6-phosphate dehydrogenase [Terriglobales bacterium]
MRAPTPQPSLFIVFGGTGDLMREKLLAALHRLHTTGQLHPRTRILATARSRDFNDASYQAQAATWLQRDGAAAPALAAWCRESLFFQSIGAGQPADFTALAQRIAALETQQALPGNRVFYLALPPQAFPGTIQGLGGAQLNRGPGWTRLVIEKPFGRDLASARELNHLVHREFEENQVYRIDHYLGKETVQNLLAFRVANPIFETLWNRDRVDNVQLTVAESAGIGGRAGYYEQAGALRDMVQNHLTQLLTLVAMELPSSFDADAIRDEKVKVLRSISPIEPTQVIYGQYGHDSRLPAQNAAPGPSYREEAGVAKDSRTETYAALHLEIANWRWHGVPFYLRTGKHLPQRVTQVVVNFRRAPVSLLRQAAARRPNALVITIQPNEGFDLLVDVKAPGQGMTLQSQRLHFRYSEAFSELAEAYETLLLDILAGDQTLFVRADEVEASWTLYAPLLAAPPRIHPYPSNTWGPQAADALLARHNHEWGACE